MSSPTSNRAARVKVWTGGVRVLHWLLAASVAWCWASGYGLARWHEAIGYVAGAVVCIRCGLGWFGHGHARFSSFVARPARVMAYIRQMRAGQYPRHLGHNPLGGCMVIALLLCVGGLVLTGFLFTTDLLWGYAWVESLHRALSWTLMALVAAHVTAVLVMSALERENLIRAMLNGYKKAR